jgi:hypothetical protein
VVGLVCLPIFDEIDKKHLSRITIKTEKTRLYRQTLNRMITSNIIVNN